MRSQRFLGEWARSGVFINKDMTPSISRITAYLELARGQDPLLQSPVVE